MNLRVTSLDDGITLVALSGRMDVTGTQEIEMKLTTSTAVRKAAIIVDLSGMEFLASIGIRALLSNAKAQGMRGGKMVLCNPRLPVQQVLEATGIDTLIPMFRTVEAAQEYLAPLARELKD